MSRARGGGGPMCSESEHGSSPSKKVGSSMTRSSGPCAFAFIAPTLRGSGIRRCGSMTCVLPGRAGAVEPSRCGASPSMRERPCDAEADVTIVHVRRATATVGHSENARQVDPGTAAEHTTTCVIACAFPCHTRVDDRLGHIRIRQMIAILDPLPHVTGDVVEAIGVGGETADR